MLFFGYISVLQTLAGDLVIRLPIAWLWTWGKARLVGVCAVTADSRGNEGWRDHCDAESSRRAAVTAAAHSEVPLITP
jgi:hypothetical protein